MWKRSLVSIALFASCADPTAVEVEGVRAWFSEEGLRVHNTRDASVYFFAGDRVDMSLIDWIPCSHPGCPGAEAGSTVTIPYSEIAGWDSSSREALLYWWNLRPHPADGWEADQRRVLLVGQ